MSRRYSSKRPSLRWDGTLYKPQTFGERPKAGTVDWAKAQRQNRSHAAHVRRVIAEREAERKRPARWYLVSWPFVVYRLLARWVERRWP